VAHLTGNRDSGFRPRSCCSLALTRECSSRLFDYWRYRAPPAVHLKSPHGLRPGATPRARSCHGSRPPPRRCVWPADDMRGPPAGSIQAEQPARPRTEALTPYLRASRVPRPEPPPGALGYALVNQQVTCTRWGWWEAVGAAERGRVTRIVDRCQQAVRAASPEGRAAPCATVMQENNPGLCHQENVDSARHLHL
jgi:hypothetical protein